MGLPPTQTPLPDAMEERGSSHSRDLAEMSPRPRSHRALTAVAVLVGVSMVGYVAYRQYRAFHLAGTVRAFTHSGQLEQARKALRLWLEIKPQSAEAHYYKARLALSANQPAEALLAIEQAARLGFDRSWLACLTAIIQARSKRLAEAEPVLLQAYLNELEPRADVAQELAHIYLSTYRLSQAAGPIERWRSLAPHDPRPYLWLNEIESRSDAPPETLIQNYRAALERDPTLGSARLGLAEQLNKDSRFAEAEQEYRQHLKRTPNDAVALVGLGRNSLRQGDVDAAIEHFEAALTANPRQPDALKELAQIDLRLGRHRKACERLETLTQIEPFDSTIRYSFAQALRVAGDEVRSRSEAAKAEQFRKDDEHLTKLRNDLLNQPGNADARFEVAKWMLDHGHDAEGLEWTQEILRADPRHVPTHGLLADYHQKQGSTGLANYHRLMMSSTKDDAKHEQHPPTMTVP